ncbi:MAG TPA: FAD-dependent oxidoreductase [Actinomycetota bacterium]|jgi:NAD(P)-dependent dehydrogenase (short-subunit alcohol dehydrogenase family)|nr:FAD-dependent oxidoreductase [Actinomycetota bacterium]
MKEQVADVLVVGAGPTGLTAAISLLAHGHEVTIVDRRPEGQLVSVPFPDGTIKLVANVAEAPPEPQVGFLQKLVDTRGHGPAGPRPPQCRPRRAESLRPPPPGLAAVPAHLPVTESLASSGSGRTLALAGAAPGVRVIATARRTDQPVLR